MPALEPAFRERASMYLSTHSHSSVVLQSVTFWTPAPTMRAHTCVCTHIQNLQLLPMALRNVPQAAFALPLPHFPGYQSALPSESAKGHTDPLADVTVGAVVKQRGVTPCATRPNRPGYLVTAPAGSLRVSLPDGPLAGSLRPLPHLLPPCFLQTPSPSPCPVILPDTH